jgi:glycosyltransferase involved in cell wall biosynthesis
MAAGWWGGQMTQAAPVIAVVIPCYKVSRHILSVLANIGKEVAIIYVVDDKCPEGSGLLVQAQCHDPRVRVIFHDINKGVGGATISGYRQAVADGATVAVKIDGDGQMDSGLIPMFVHPILSGHADYTKGNRFFDIELLTSMPRLRLFGNSVLSLVSKVASGYWDIMDPTNGFTAIHTTVLKHLSLDKLDERYFFESDMLFRLNVTRAVVQDIPLEARYGDEESSLNIARVAREFPAKFRPL